MDIATGQGIASSGQSNMQWLQQLLNALGAQPPLDVDGKIGPKTMAAINNFQRASGVPTGGFGMQSLIAAQMNPGAQQIGDWNRNALQRTTGGTGTNTAPGVNAGRPDGTIRAGDMQRELESRRTGVQAPITGPGGSVQTNTPFISQYDGRVPRAGDTACYRACREMLLRAGVNAPQGTGNRIQVANSETSTGGVNTTRGQTDQARAYIDSQLAAGKPVTIGVSHKAGYQGNADSLTDHFVAITGRGTDAQGRTFYTANDPATTDAGRGSSARFYVDQQSGNLVREGNVAHGYVAERHQELSMVVRNP